MNIGTTLSPHNPLYKKLCDELEKNGHSLYCVSTLVNTDMVLLIAKQLQCLVVDFCEPTADQFIEYKLPHLEFVCINSGLAMGVMLERKLPIVLYDTSYPEFTSRAWLGETTDSRGAVCNDSQQLITVLVSAANDFAKQPNVDRFLSHLRTGFTTVQPDKPGNIQPVAPVDYALFADPDGKYMQEIEREALSRGKTVTVVKDALSTYPLDLSIWEQFRAAKMVIMSIPNDCEVMLNLVKRAMICGMLIERKIPLIGVWCMTDDKTGKITDSVGMFNEYVVESLVHMGVMTHSADNKDIAKLLDTCDTLLGGKKTSEMVAQAVSATQ